MEKLTTIPGLIGLVQNPFLLTLALGALPTVVEGKHDISKIRISRVHLYDSFVNHWTSANRRRLQSLKLCLDEQRVLDELLDDGFELNVIRFQVDLAAAIFQEQEGKPLVSYYPKRDKFTWKAAFFGTDPEKALLRDASLLTRTGSLHRFVHRSILEYFYSCTVCPPPAVEDEFAPQGSLGTASTPPCVSHHPLSKRSLVMESSIVQFLAERAQANPEFKRQLHALLELSKTDEHASQAAANAITILVRIGVQFNGADLRGIKIPGAGLSGGQFDSAQLQEAILTGVNLCESWIRQADFSNARMDGVQFGELPYLVECGEVHACTFSPDGRSFAVGLDIGNINMYDTTTWTRTHVLRGHQCRITSLAYSPSSHRLLSGSKDKTVRLWSYPTWFCDIILTKHTEKVTAVAFSSSGRQVASASDDKSVRLWDAEKGSLVAVLGHDSRVTCLAYSPDGLTIVSGCDDGAIRTFNAQTGMRGLALECGYAPDEMGMCGEICCVTFSPDGQLILLGTGSGTLQLRVVNSGMPRLSWKGHDRAVSSVIYSPNGQWVASASHDRTVKLWNAQAGTLVSALTGHKAAVVSISYSGGCAQLASCGSDMTVRLWEVNDVLAGPDYRGSIDSVTSAAYSPDGTHLIYESTDGYILRYDISNNQSGLAVPPGCYDGGIISYWTDDHCIAATKYNNLAHIWNTEMRGLSRALPKHLVYKRGVNAMTFSPCGRWTAAGSINGTVILRDARSRLQCRTFYGHSALVTSVSFSPSGSHIVSGSYDGSVRIWALENSKSHRMLLHPDVSRMIETVAWLQTMPLIALADGRREIQLWTEQTGMIHQHLIHDKGVSAFGVSSCGQWIAAGCANSVWLWHCSPNDESHHWERAALISNVFERIKAIVWKPQDHEFVFNCADGSARGWRLEEVSNEMSAKLVWSIGSKAFEASGAVITATVGLSRTNRRLLKQRGAVDESSTSSGLEGEESLGMRELSDPLEASSLSDTEGWQWEEETGSDAFISEDEEDDEEDDEGEDPMDESASE